jgi:hypothetical protein
MRILFLEGSAYNFEGVSAKLYNQLMEADSKGTFFQEYIKGQYNFRKVNLEKERTTMGMNKAQKAAAAREAAAKTAQPQPAAAAEQAKPEASAAVTALPAPASKQTATFDKLKEAWTAKGVDLSKLTVKPDGKFVLVTVAEGWPVVQIGPTGGITLPQIRSYPKAFDAAVDGLAVFTKQKERDAKKTAAGALEPQAPPAPAPAVKQEPKETPTAKKGKAHQQIEQQLQSASA